MTTDGKKNAHQTLTQPLARMYRSKILITISLVGAAVSTFYALLLHFLYDSAYILISDAFYALMYLCTLVFINKEKLSFSAYWLVFWAGIQVSAGSALFVGSNTGFQLYFLTLPVLIYFLLWQEPFWARFAVMLYGACLFIAGHTLSIPDLQVPIPETLANIIFIANVLIIFFITFFAVKHFSDELEKAYKQQEELVLTDQETGLPNKKFISQHARQLLALCDRYGHPISLIRIKLHSEHHSLVTTSSTLKTHSREADIVARWESDEFVILLPETSPEDTLVLISRLFQSSHQDENEGTELTFGYSYCDSQSMHTIEELIDAANPVKQAKLTTP